MIDKAVTGKIWSVLVWCVVSMAISYALSLFDPSAMLGRAATSQHEAAVRAAVVRPSDIEETLADVGGLSAVKEELFYSVLLPLSQPTTFFRPHGPFATSRGVLLCGPPGCGKTLLMKAVCRTCGCTFIAPSMAMLQNKYYGESQKLLTALFAVAAREAPSIVFIDEIDSAFRTRTDEDSSADYVLKTEFLSLMDGLRTKSTVPTIVVGATNNPDALDPALRRRLPTVLEVGLPTPDERRRIVRLACRDEPRGSASAFDDAVNERFDGATGADLLEAYRTASRRRLRALLAARAPLTAAALPPLGPDDWIAAADALATRRTATSTRHCAGASRLDQLVEALGRPAQQKATGP